MDKFEDFIFIFFRLMGDSCEYVLKHPIYVYIFCCLTIDGTFKSLPSELST